MTTYDPDTLRKDRSVLKRIVDEFDGRMALDCAGEHSIPGIRQHP
jgi:hypothetical protein